MQSLCVTVCLPNWLCATYLLRSHKTWEKPWLVLHFMLRSQKVLVGKGLIYMQWKKSQYKMDIEDST